MERKESEGIEEEEKKEVPAALSAPEPEKNDDFGDFDDSDESVSESSSSEESDSFPVCCASHL